LGSKPLRLTLLLAVEESDKPIEEHRLIDLLMTGLRLPLAIGHSKIVLKRARIRIRALRG
jgi:hypothetical protein